jgi:hypothetical protein
VAKTATDRHRGDHAEDPVTVEAVGGGPMMSWSHRIGIRRAELESNDLRAMGRPIRLCQSPHSSISPSERTMT